MFTPTRRGGYWLGVIVRKRPDSPLKGDPPLRRGRWGRTKRSLRAVAGAARFDNGLGAVGDP